VREFDIEWSEYTLSHHRDPQHQAEEPEIDRETRQEGETREAEESAVAGDVSQEERELSQMAETLARLEAERQELRQVLISRQADFENFRKRIERERREDRDRSVMLLAESMLPVLDNFERALAAHQDPAYADYRRGFEMIHRQLSDLLAEHGIVRMEDPTGKKFDPHLHHAFERVETGELPEETVIGEVQAGYRFRDKVLRPAQVRVAVPPVHPASVEQAVN
jgi:molecular chaperone GrpE